MNDTLLPSKSIRMRFLLFFFHLCLFFSCSLVTFYFTRAVCTMTQEKAIKFVRNFGAYLNLSRSLAVTSRLRYGKVIDLLLDMAAKYDVIHKTAKLDFDKIKTGLAMGDQVSFRFYTHIECVLNVVLTIIFFRSIPYKIPLYLASFISFIPVH
jgi:hypothetical protein